MKAKVNFEEGNVTQMKVKDGSDTIAYAEMNGDGAYIRTVYPLPGHEGVKVESVGEVVECLEQLPFVDYAKFNYKP
jgi:hypothetical protein